MPFPNKEQKSKNYIINVFLKNKEKLRRKDYEYDLPIRFIPIPLDKKNDVHYISNEMYVMYKELSLVSIEPYHVIYIAEDKFDNTGV